MADAEPQSPQTPQLQWLALRSADRPLDLRPRFSATHYLYRAEVDFACANFAVDALPAQGSKITDGGATQTTNLVEPGAERRVAIGVSTNTGPAGDMKMEYTVIVRRLDGTDVRLRGMRVPGAELTPPFREDIASYEVRMPAAVAALHLRILLADAGQRLSSLMLPPGIKGPKHPPQMVHGGSSSSSSSSGGSAALPAPTPPPRNGPTAAPVVPAVPGNASSGTQRDTFDPFAAAERYSAGPAAAPVRRLLPFSMLMPPESGETQHTVLRRDFQIGVGEERWAAVAVRPANGDAALEQIYWLHVVREACPPHQPYYAPDIGLCAVTCNDGYFPNDEVSLCTSCPRNCLTCKGWDLCEACEPSEWQVLRFMELRHGRCEEVRIPWKEGLAALAGCLILLALLCRCCAACCTCNCGGARSRWVGASSPPSDVSDLEGMQSVRLLDEEESGSE